MRTLPDAIRTLPTDRVRRMYGRVLANWAHDCLTARPVLEWPEPDPLADPFDRDWTKLYQGSVLDD